MNDDSLCENDVSPPSFAPLPVSFFTHACKLLAQPGRKVEYHVKTYRSAVYTYMDPNVQTELVHRKKRQALRSQASNIDTGWLIASLAQSSPGKRRIPLPTLSDWHTRNLMRYREWGYPDFQSAAALLLMRMICPHPRGWLPSTMEKQEPQWWCWRQDGPEQPVVVCPYPLPPDLPDEALLWTPWSGAAWDEEWMPLGSKGALRWARMKHSVRKYWKLSLPQLASWDEEVASLHTLQRGAGYGEQEAEDQFMHVLATAALYRLARGRLL